MKWWSMRPGPEREVAKAASAPKPEPRKPPRWRRVRGPTGIRREETAWRSSFRRCEFTPGDKASELWAWARVMAPTACPVAVTVSMDGERLKIDYGDKSYYLPLALIGSPSDADFTIRQIRFATREMSCNETNNSPTP